MKTKQYLPTVTGNSLVRPISFLNHSCDPNVDCDYPLHDVGVVAKALRDIEQGEELTISYIDESLPLGINLVPRGDRHPVKYIVW